MIGYLRKSLPGRVIGLLILGFGLLNALTVYLFFEERGRAVRLSQMEDLVVRSAAIDRLLNTTPQQRHGQIISSVSTARLTFTVTEEPLVAEHQQADREHPLFQQLSQESRISSLARLAIGPRYYWCHSWVKNLLNMEMPFSHYDRMRPIAVISMRQSNGGWLNAALMPDSSFPGWVAALLVALTLFTLSVLIVVLIVRRVTRPLALLTRATDKVGRGSWQPIPERGPEDVRRTARAFNRMQQRIERFVQNRTQMLAAISHDLRTPLTSLRLQAEFIADTATREKMLHTLDELQEMTDATLDFTREESSREASRKVDMDALIASLCDDLEAAGLTADFSPGERMTLECRPAAIKRALQNLIENANYYASGARISLTRQQDELVISVIDSGPGIAEADWQRVFDPFVRLETSRNRNTGGIGLGLAIVRSVAHAHGGEIYLNNIQTQTEIQARVKGLEAQLRLPVSCCSGAGQPQESRTDR